MRKAQHLFAVARDRRDYREFVTAKTRDQITAPQGMRKPQGHVADQFIPNVMPKRIVDVLEVIEVDIENSRGRAAVFDFLDHRLEALAEKNAIGKAAERVMHGEMAQA